MNSEQALQQVQNTQANMQSPDQLLTQTMQSTGAQQAQQQVGGLRQAINNTTNILSQIAPRTMGATKNSLMTTAGANKVIQNEQVPVQGRLSAQQGQFDDANAVYEPLQRRAVALADQDLQSKYGQMKALQDVYKGTYAGELAALNQSNLQRAQSAQEQIAKREAAKTRASGGRSSSGSSSSGGASNRDVYNSTLSQLESRLKAGQAPHYEQAVSQLVNEFGGRGISPQEIGDYLYQLYSRYFNTSQTKKFYG